MRLGDAGGDGLSFMAKAYAGEAYVKVTGDGMQAHGGIGFTWEHDAHLYWRRAKVDRFLLGDDVAAYDEVARLAMGQAVAATDSAVAR